MESLLHQPDMVAPTEPRRIVLQAGNYFLSEPLVLDHRDSGLAIEAAKGRQVVLYGGRRISGLKQDGGLLKVVVENFAIDGDDGHFGATCAQVDGEDGLGVCG